jgi:hypothetical protein
MTNPNPSWGVVALGVHGHVSAELLSHPGEEEAWLLQLAGRGWQASLSVGGPDSVDAFAAFIDHYSDQVEFAEHRIGSFHSAEAVLVKDSEHPDRFWLRIRGEGQLMEVAIQDHEAVALQRAMRSLVEELE